MSQAEIDALLKDSMFEDSSIQESKQPKTEKQTEQNYEESNNYGNEQFESYEESRKTFEKNVSKKGIKQLKQSLMKEKSPFSPKNLCKILNKKLRTLTKVCQKIKKNKNLLKSQSPRQEFIFILPNNTLQVHQSQTKKIFLTTMQGFNKEKRSFF